MVLAFAFTVTSENQNIVYLDPKSVLLALR